MSQNKESVDLYDIPGGGTTSAALCDTILASDKATFSTPFKQLGVNPEGCSSVHFEKYFQSLLSIVHYGFYRILGGVVANKLLDEGWKPTAIEAKDCGLVEEVVQHENLLTRAQVIVIVLLQSCEYM